MGPTATRALVAAVGLRTVGLAGHHRAGRSGGSAGRRPGESSSTVPQASGRVPRHSNRDLPRPAGRKVSGRGLAGSGGTLVSAHDRESSPTVQSLPSAASHPARSRSRTSSQVPSSDQRRCQLRRPADLTPRPSVVAPQTLIIYAEFLYPNERADPRGRLQRGSEPNQASRTTQEDEKPPCQRQHQRSETPHGRRAKPWVIERSARRRRLIQSLFGPDRLAGRGIAGAPAAGELGYQ